MITLHSNLVIFQLSSEADIKSLGASFTFQSGYIPTRSTIKPLLNTKCLYIPIWLYSNGQGDLNCTVSCASLHSNLVIFQPASLYTCADRLRIFTFQSGYIPTFDFHTNLFLFLHFTFQSGYIPTLCERQDRLWPKSALHSNLVIFQLEKVEGGRVYTIALHSNLVIFQLLPSSKYVNLSFPFTFQSGYIPTGLLSSTK